MKTLVFDFDGTLCHSMPLIDKAFEEALSKYTKKELTDEELKSCFGPDEEGIVLKLFGKEVYRKAFNDYLIAYERLHDEYLKDFMPGIRELLEKLKEEGFSIFVLTGRSVESSMISLVKLDGLKYFDDFYYGDLYKAVKDIRIKELCEDHNLKVEDLIYIGDSSKDIDQCRTAGVKIISAAYDTFEKHDGFEEKNPGMVAHTVEELKQLIYKYAK